MPDTTLLEDALAIIQTSLDFFRNEDILDFSDAVAIPPELQRNYIALLKRAGREVSEEIVGAMWEDRKEGE